MTAVPETFSETTALLVEQMFVGPLWPASILICVLVAYTLLAMVGLIDFGIDAPEIDLDPGLDIDPAIDIDVPDVDGIPADGIPADWDFGRGSAPHPYVGQTLVAFQLLYGVQYSLLDIGRCLTCCGTVLMRIDTSQQSYQACCCRFETLSSPWQSPKAVRNLCSDTSLAAPLTMNRRSSGQRVRSAQPKRRATLVKPSFERMPHRCF
jgi:hypothetical protein